MPNAKSDTKGADLLVDEVKAVVREKPKRVRCSSAERVQGWFPGVESNPGHEEEPRAFENSRAPYRKSGLLRLLVLERQSRDLLLVALGPIEFKVELS